MVAIQTPSAAPPAEEQRERLEALYRLAVEIAGLRDYARNHLIPLRPNIFARAVLENRPVRSLDALHDEQRVGQPLGHSPVGAFLGIPLCLQGRRSG